MLMNPEQIKIEQDGLVLTIRLDRPESKNAWTWQMGAELASAFEAADADDGVRAIVVTGEGDMFCAGADLSASGETFAGEPDVLGSRDQVRAVLKARPTQEMNTPIIAAINGAAVGAGLTMPMQWDLRVVAEDAKLGFVFNRRGIMPDADLLWLIPRMIGHGPAMDLLLTGRTFSGDEARELGLAHRSVPREDVLETALEMAHDIATNTAPASVAITKRLLYEFLTETDWPTARRRQNDLFQWTSQQPDAIEGVMAFLEKREPAWAVSKNDLPPGLGST